MAAITSHIPSLRRQIKNVACNYSDAHVKVREATSNDPWGASSSLMSEIADLTYNAMAFTEIMQMIWKRLNDHGKNWRHVYKSLVLLDYLIKVGSEKVAQQCRENVYAIQTLKDFQHIEDNKDQGMNVREKAKQLVAMLKDDERLKNERAKALMARKRFTQNGTGVGSDGRRFEMSRSDSELEECRPTSSGEEELQLQIALAISKEEAEKETEAKKSDDMRLQLALQESKHDGGTRGRPASTGTNAFGTGSSSSAGVSDFAGQSASTKNTSALDDLLSLQPSMPTYSTNAWGQSSSVTGTTDFFKAASLPSLTEANLNDPWGQGQGQQSAEPGAPHHGDPFGEHTSSNSAGGFGYSSDPWSSNQANFGVVNGQYNTAHPSANLSGISSSPDPWGSDALSPAPLNHSGGQSSSDSSSNAGNLGQSRKLKTPDNFLGENSSLVNLDNLMAGSMKSTVPGMPPKTGGPIVANPFASTTSGGANNPFLVANQRATPPTLNEIRLTSSSSLTNQQKMSGATASASTNQGWPSSSSTNQNQTPFNGTVTSPGSTNPFL